MKLGFQFLLGYASARTAYQVYYSSMHGNLIQYNVYRINQRHILLGTCVRSSADSIHPKVLEEIEKCKTTCIENKVHFEYEGRKTKNTAGDNIRLLSEIMLDKRKDISGNEVNSIPDWVGTKFGIMWINSILRYIYSLNNFFVLHAEDKGNCIVYFNDDSLTVKYDQDGEIKLFSKNNSYLSEFFGFNATDLIYKQKQLMRTILRQNILDEQSSLLLPKIKKEIRSDKPVLIAVDNKHVAALVRELHEHNQVEKYSYRDNEFKQI